MAGSDGRPSTISTHERELTAAVDLCRPDGRLLDPAAMGWSRTPMHRANLRGRRLRTKKWDYWAVLAGDLVVGLVYADIGYLGLASVWWGDLRTGETGGRDLARPFARGITLPDVPASAPLRVDDRHLSMRLADEPGGTPNEVDQGDVVADEVWTPQGEFMAPAEVEAGWWEPVDQYACIEQALGHAEGRTPEQLRDEVAGLWVAMNDVATHNPDAAFGEARSIEQLRAPGPGNRPLALPYAKWHSTQWAVDQAGAMLLCSAALAAELDIDPGRWLFPHVLLESSFARSLSRRAELHRWPAMRVLGDAAAAHLGQPLAEVRHTEVYSCFPSAVRVQQRELALALDVAPTVTGGMAFAGGPFNNFTYQATAAVAARLREDPGSLGMVTTVSGLLTKPALAVWSTRPPGDGTLIEDLAPAADAATGTVDSTAHHVGEGVVATFTVTYDGTTPARALVLADLPDGSRWVGSSDDPALISTATGAGLIGSTVRIDDTTCRPG